jgi:hypothetical protein
VKVYQSYEDVLMPPPIAWVQRHRFFAYKGIPYTTEDFKKQVIYPKFIRHLRHNKCFHSLQKIIEREESIQFLIDYGKQVFL